MMANLMLTPCSDLQVYNRYTQSYSEVHAQNVEHNIFFPAVNAMRRSIGMYSYHIIAIFVVVALWEKLVRLDHKNIMIIWSTRSSPKKKTTVVVQHRDTYEDNIFKLTYQTTGALYNLHSRTLLVFENKGLVQSKRSSQCTHKEADSGGVHIIQ